MQARRRRRSNASRKQKTYLYTAVFVLSLILLGLCGCALALNSDNDTKPGATTGATDPAGTAGTNGTTDPTDPGSDPSDPTDPVKPDPAWVTGYIASVDSEAAYYDKDGKELGKIQRGTEIEYLANVEGNIQIRFNNTTAYLHEATAVTDVKKVIPAHTLYVRTPVNLRDVDGKLLKPLAAKGAAVEVTGYDYLKNDGTAHMYQVKLNGESGYIMPWYVVKTEAGALENYDEGGYYTENHSQRDNRFGGGDAASLDYFPREKGDIPGNVMPGEVRSLYLVSWKLYMVDEYIKLAKQSDINAFVVDIMDGSAIGYDSDVMKQYSPTAASNAANTKSAYAAAVKKLKDAGFYVIGRITVFNDYYFAVDNKDTDPTATITDNNGKLLKLGDTYWPSGYSRLAWQYKVDLSVEAVKLMGFNEIQYDYVRFPDLTSSYEKAGTIDYHNTYGETKAQAIQRFLMYATDILHEYNVYVSADVFGETGNNYVAAYGQYWPAISNVVDVISGMPYPDHWAPYGGFIPWEDPYRTIADWGYKVVQRQKETATPAIVRTWIQAYDTNWKKPYVHYGPDKVLAQIQALRDTGCTGGFMTWNGASVYDKYKELLPAFKAP